MPATKCEEGDRTSQLELSDGALDKPRRLGCSMALQVLSTKPSPRKSEAEEREQNGSEDEEGGAGGGSGRKASTEQGARHSGERARWAFQAHDLQVITEIIK